MMWQRGLFLEGATVQMVAPFTEMGHPHHHPRGASGRGKDNEFRLNNPFYTPPRHQEGRPPIVMSPRPIYYPTRQLPVAPQAFQSLRSRPSGRAASAIGTTLRPAVFRASPPATSRGLAALLGLAPRPAAPPRNSRLRASDTFSAARFSACSSCWMPCD